MTPTKSVIESLVAALRETERELFLRDRLDGVLHSSDRARYREELEVARATGKRLREEAYEKARTWSA